MLCLACARPASGLCVACRRSLRPAPERRVGHVVVRSGYRHAGAAARLVHNLKYRRCLGSADLLVDAMAGHLPLDAACLVPVPRSAVRKLRYGVDQTSVLADRLAARTALPIVTSFTAPVWWRRRAGMAREDRGRVGFRPTRPLPVGAVIVDDVLTTGATVASLAATVDHRQFVVVTATAAGTMESMGGGPRRVRR